MGRNGEGWRYCVMYRMGVGGEGRCIRRGGRKGKWGGGGIEKRGRGKGEGGGGKKYKYVPSS